MKKTNKQSLNIRPVKLRGNIISGYYSLSNGDILSIKNPTAPVILKPSTTKTDPYPRVNLSKYGTAYLHRINCETWNGSPNFNGLTDQELNSIPEGIRSKLLNYVTHVDRYQVNHIDHNPFNFHPTNLEWVEHSRENNEKYMINKKSKQVL